MPFVDFWVPSDEFVADPNWEGVPHCQICDANLRPDITLFNESLPVDELHRVKRALRDCDLFFGGRHIGRCGSGVGVRARRGL